MTDQEDQPLSRAVWMQRLFSEYTKDHRYCGVCGHSLLVVSDSFTSKGEYKVSRYCTPCRMPTDVRMPSDWVARTIARIRRDRQTQGGS